MPLILAHELDTLTVRDIQEWDRCAGNEASIFIDVIDKRNLTDKRLERLKSLVQQDDELSGSCAVDAHELNAKLRQISPRRSPTPSDTASTPMTAGGELTEAEVIEGVQRIAYRDHEKLKSMGGRPSREINADPGPCPSFKSDIDKRYHVSDHWYREAGRIERELKRWLDFRWHQFETRVDSKRFCRYTKAVHKHQEENGLNWALELQLNQQTKMDEWREYYIYEHRKRRALEKELVRTKRELASAKERATKAKSNGSIGVPPTALSGRWGELIEYKEKMSHAQKEVDMAQRRLKLLSVEESLSAVERDILITQAKEDLELAQKRLEVEMSDELEQLNKESDRTRAQAGLTHCQSAVDWANTRLEQLDALLEWIAVQFAEIATEYASSNWGSLYNRDLLEGWVRYYVYMRERLQMKQDRDTEWLQSGWAREQTEAEEARDDILFPQERVRPLEALLAWIEREFLDIAAKHASSSQHSQFNNDHRAETGLPCPKPSPDGPTRKAARKNTRCRGESAKERLRLHQVQTSRISKSSRRGKTGLPEAVVRRSERVSQKIHDRALPSLGSIRFSKASSQRLPDGAVRRSARILDRTSKTRSLRLGPDGKLAPSTTAAGRKRTWPTCVHTDAPYLGHRKGSRRQGTGMLHVTTNHPLALLSDALPYDYGANAHGVAKCS